MQDWTTAVPSTNTNMSVCCGSKYRFGPAEGDASSYKHEPKPESEKCIEHSNHPYSQF